MNTILSLVDDLEIIKEARSIIENEKNWTKNLMARTKDGNLVQSYSEEAVCWCMAGALHRAFNKFQLYGEYKGTTIVEEFNNIIKNQNTNSNGTPIHLNVSAFNDDPDTTHEDVLRVFDRVIEKYERRDGI